MLLITIVGYFTYLSKIVVKIGQDDRQIPLKSIK